MSLCNTNRSLFKLRNENSRLLEQLECNDALLVNKKRNLQQLCRSPEESVNLRTEESALTWKERSESWRSGYYGVPSFSENDHFCKLSNHALRSVLVNSSLKLRKPLFNLSGHASIILNYKLKLVEDAASGKVRTPRKGFVVRPRSIYPTIMAEKGKILAKRKDKKSSQQRRLKSNVKSGRPSARSKNKPEKKQKLPSDIAESGKEVEHNKEDVPVPKEEVADPSTPDICSRCLDEARHLLNYSPKSLFLRRMKQRLARFEKKTGKNKLSSDLSESKNDSSDTCSECSSEAQNCSSLNTCSKAEISIKAQICPNKLKSSQTLLGVNTVSSSKCDKCLRRHCLCARTFAQAYSNSPNIPDSRKYHVTQNSSNVHNAPDMVNGCNAPNCSKALNSCNATNCTRALNSSNSLNFPKVPNCCNKANCPKVLNYVNVLNTLKALRALKSPKEQIRENIKRIQCCRHGESSQAHHSERPRSEPRTSDDFCEKKAYKSESNCREMHKMKQEHHRASQKRCFSQPTFRNTCMKSNPSHKNHDVNTKKNSSRKIIRTRSNATQVSGKCSCKKESGGRCCCEKDDRNPELVCKLPCCTQEISVQVPEALEISVQASGEGAEGLQEAATGSGEGRRVPSGGGGTGGGRERNSVSVSTTTEPTLQHYEALCHFRQKHWFDCHAHPHGVSDLPETKMQVAAACSPDADILGPLEDPCFRLYCLNKRLFPEVFSETHGAGCCVSAQNACSPPTLLPNQRRLITLPALSPQYSLQNGNTMKLPCGVRFFPSSNVLVCDPKTLAAPPPPPTPPQPTPPPPPPKQTAPSSPSKARRMHIPVPTNSLALRFQKGVV